MALPFEMRIHTKISLSHLGLGIEIPPLTADGHGYRKPTHLLEQIPMWTAQG